MEPDDAVLQLRPNAATWVDEDGETVALDLDRAWYVGVNRSGTILWKVLARGATRAELLQELLVTYDIPRRQAKADLDSFLLACQERGLLR